MKVVSYSRWSLNTGFNLLIKEGGVVSEQWSLKAEVYFIQMVSNTGLPVRKTFTRYYQSFEKAGVAFVKGAHERNYFFEKKKQT